MAKPQRSRHFDERSLRARNGRPRALFLLMVLACLLPNMLAAQIYKYTDEDGIVHYTSERPPEGHSFKRFNFPCYASDPKCGRQVNWEQVPLNTTAWRDSIEQAAAEYAVDAALVRAVIHAESAYQVDAKSPKGAQGLMQLMPATARELDVADAFDPESNIWGGTRYLAAMLELFDGDLTLASAAYNAGPGAVQRYGGVPPYAETKEYVRRIRILHRRYREAGA